VIKMNLIILNLNLIGAIAIELGTIQFIKYFREKRR